MSACPYLRGQKWSCCQAVEGGSVVPTLHERERYCRDGGAHRRCPTFVVMTTRGRLLTEGEHFALLCEGPEALLEGPRPAAPRPGASASA